MRQPNKTKRTVPDMDVDASQIATILPAATTLQLLPLFHHQHMPYSSHCNINKFRNSKCCHLKKSNFILKGDPEW